MASALDKARRRNRESSVKQEWSTTGSFVHKPVKGWLHPDEQLLPDAGVCYGLRYIGCMVVKHAMKALDFDTRTAIAKESISRVCDAAGLKTAAKKSKRATKVGKYLGEEPSMLYAGSNVNLTITTESINMVIMETGETIGDHQMPGVSFASGGDPDTMDFVAYVAKDAINGRACYVLECGGGLAQDVITTVGQAFELRFKQFLAQRPEAVALPDRLENPVFNGGSGDAWGNEEEYYNDRPGAMPPSPTRSPMYTTPTSNQLVSDGAFDMAKDPNQLGAEFGSHPYDNSLQGGAVGGVVYDNQQGVLNGVGSIVSHTDGNGYDDEPEGGAAAAAAVAKSPGSGNLDVFDMTPFSSSLPPYTPAAAAGGGASNTEVSLQDEKWFHGRITRQQCEVLLKEDGEFLVRESANSPGQFVLSGRQSGRVKHLLLVDPEGVVRTKDRSFDSVSHLISYHVGGAVPITSNDSELLLCKAINKFG